MNKRIERIGEMVTVYLGGVYVECRILDVKEKYGQLRWQITPVAGSGTVWKEGL